MADSGKDIISCDSISNILCHHCKKWRGEVGKLKRCAGCKVVAYCGKECQKAAWPEHRQVCRKAPPAKETGALIDFGELGYPMPISLHQAVCEWIEAQHWVLSTLTDALILLDGGIDYNISHPRGVVVILEALPKTDDLNPALAFKLLGAEVDNHDRYPGLVSGWRDLLGDCREAHKALTKLFESSADLEFDRSTTFVTVFPVMYVVQDTGMMAGHKHILFRRPIQHVPRPDALDDPRTRAALEDVAQLCMYLAGSVEIVLRACEGPCLDGLPDVGRMVRSKSKKTWRWEEVPWDWDAWVLPSTEVSRTSGLSPKQLLTVMDKSTSPEDLDWCKVVAYCSKDCQKAAWPVHKQVCRKATATETGDFDCRDLGYPTPISLHQRLCDWMGVHHWVLVTLLDALILLDGGMDYNLSHQRGAVVILEAIPKTDDLDPARSFKLLGAEVNDQDQYPQLASSWSDLNKVCKDAIKTMTAIFERSGLPAESWPVAVFPAMFVVQDTGMMAGQKHILFRRRLRHVPRPDVLDHPRTREVVEDVAQLCMYLAENEIVLRAAANGPSPQGLPDVGRMIQAPKSKKGWKWESISWNWDTWTIPPTEVLLRSELSLRELVTVFGRSTHTNADFPRSNTHCHKCFKANSKLRCTGCHVVVYCSKECQKGAWPEHKSMCLHEPKANVELQASDLGYPSNLSLSVALNDWIEIQRWSLYTLICALVMLDGGVDAVLASQKAVVLYVIPTHRNEHDGNPGKAFRIGQAVLKDKDGDAFLRKHWTDVWAIKNLCSTNSALAFLHVKQHGDDLFPTPIGSIPVVYYVHRTDMASCDAFTLFHLPLLHVDGNMKDAPVDARALAACEELVYIVKGFLCGGKVVYRHADQPGRVEPVWGIYERTGRRMKKWKWRQLPVHRESEGWRSWERRADEIWPGRASGLTPRQLVTLLDYRGLGTEWWPLCISESDATGSVAVELLPSDLGYPSFLALHHALGEWVEIQRWSLYTLTCALVELEGGPTAVLESQEKVLLLHLVARHRADEECNGGNPAMAFRFGHAVITDKASIQGIRENWAEVQKNVELVAANTAEAFLSSGRTRNPMRIPIGTFPVVYVVHRMGVVRYHAFTLFHLPLRHVRSQDVSDERTRAALEDLVRMMKEALCSILIYRRPEDPRQPEPDWWICEPVGRRRKTWRWRLFPGTEEKWRHREELLERIVPGRTSGLTARQALTLLDYRHVTWVRIFKLA
ncbi:hypothetical protein GSI_07306 [Ganoderma sinense ZZ0214-1]|uniref:MYND-type domain-containing protein n=1 Tax=Ganoderma sinense ZZ0214-1 TaxID=1077348 RepID=A0A2G8SA08_9APHY|nr:hypothetical protein GSI_07306 [Ganoderma sinense ZZ0214-1]